MIWNVRGSVFTRSKTSNFYTLSIERFPKKKKKRKILDYSKSKSSADEKINLTQNFYL